jgi:hypothetical protein
MRNVKIARKKLDRVAAQIGDREVKFSVLCRYLNKEFESLSVRFKSKAEEYYSFCVSGFFNSYSTVEFDEKRYNVNITYNKTTPYVNPNKILGEILLVLVHEFRHGHQDSRRGLKLLPADKAPKFKHFNKKLQENVLYLSDYDELDAYAYEAAYAAKLNRDNSWIVNRYKKVLGKHAPKLYFRFLKKLYLFTNK